MRRKNHTLRGGRIVSMLLSAIMLLTLAVPGTTAFATEEQQLTNVALGKKVSASLEGTGSRNPAIIVDGVSDNNYNYWDGAGAPAWFMIDLGKSYSIEKMIAYPNFWLKSEDPGADDRWYHYEIYTSSDGEAFTKVAEKKDQTPETSSGTTYVLEQPVEAKYVKVIMTGSSVLSNGMNLVHMDEFEVFAYEKAVSVEPRIILNKNSIKTMIGSTVQLRAEATDEQENAVTDVTWSSSNEEVAAVNSAGLVTAAGEGTATITAHSAKLKLSATCSIVVHDPAKDDVKEILKNVALHKPVSASVPASAEENPTLITDGDKNNYWNVGSEAYFVIDLEQEFALEKMVAYPWWGDGRYYLYEIYTSLNGKDYTKVAQKEGTAPDTENGTVYQFSEAVNARYIKVKMQRNSLSPSVCMNEFEAYARVYSDPVETQLSVNKAALKMPVGASTVLNAAGIDKWGQAADDIAWSSDNAAVTVNKEGVVQAISSGKATLTAYSRVCDKSIDVPVEVYDPAAQSDEIKLTVFWPPTGPYTNAQQYDYIAEANFNRVLGTFSSDLSNITAIMKIAGLCAERDMDFIAGEGALGFKTNLSDEIVGSVIDTYQYVPGIGGFYLIDEPYTGADYAKTYKQIAAKWPEIYPHINFLPSFVYPSLNDYEGMLDEFATLVGSDLKYLMFDRYPFGLQAGSFDAAGMFDNLNVVRKVGLKHQVKTATFIQSIGANGFRRPTASEINYEVAIALAYGYKQLAYFTYFQPVGQDETFTTAIMDASGNKTDLYEPVKEINRQVMNLSPTLIHLDAIGVYHSGSLDGQQGIPADFFAQVIGNNNVLISHMRDKDSGKDYLMVVNKDFANEQSITLSFGEDVLSVKEISKNDGKAYKLEKDGDRCTLSFAAGEGKLFAISEEPDTDKTNLNAAINQAEDVTNDSYTESSWNAFVAAKQKAIEVFADEAATQQEIDLATETLQDAMTALTPNGSSSEEKPESGASQQPGSSSQAPASSEQTGETSSSDTNSNTNPNTGYPSVIFAAVLALIVMFAAMTSCVYVSQKKRER